jgi:hypothetical protein
MQVLHALPCTQVLILDLKPLALETTRYRVAFKPPDFSTTWTGDLPLALVHEEEVYKYELSQGFARKPCGFYKLGKKPTKMAISCYPKCTR